MYCIVAGSVADAATTIVYSIAPLSVSVFTTCAIGRPLLPDRTVNANHVAAALIDDRVENNRGLAGLPVADDQFALSATDRNHRVD